MQSRLGQVALVVQVLLQTSMEQTAVTQYFQQSHLLAVVAVLVVQRQIQVVAVAALVMVELVRLEPPIKVLQVVLTPSIT
jgi:hypothetical protein